MARQLTAFARLGALGHLDLDLIRVGQVLGSHAETTRGHLLDRRAQRIAGLQFDIAFDTTLADDVGEHLARLDLAETAGIFAAFTGVRLAADPVHGDGQRGVRFGRDRAQRHGAGGETFDDFAGRFDFVDADRRAGRLDFEQTAQRHVTLGLVVDDAGVLFKSFVLARTRGVLQLGNRIRRPHVLFTADTEGVFAAGFQQMVEHRVMCKGTVMHAQRFFSHFVQANAFDLRRGAREVFLHEVRGQTDGFEDLGAVVRLIGRDTHLRHHLAQALVHGLDVALAGFVRRQLARQFASDIGNGVKGQPRANRFGAVSGEQCEVMHFTHRTRIDDQAGRGTQAGLDQMLVHGAGGQQSRNRRTFTVDAAIREDQHVVTFTYAGFSTGA